MLSKLRQHFSMAILARIFFCSFALATCYRVEVDSNALKRLRCKSLSSECLHAVAPSQLVPGDDSTNRKDGKDSETSKGSAQDPKFQERNVSEYFAKEESDEELHFLDWLTAKTEPLQMAALSKAVYDLKKKVVGWMLAKSLDASEGKKPNATYRNHVGMYVRPFPTLREDFSRQRLECTLVFEGATSFLDWANISNFNTGPFCGYQVHLGFATVLSKFLDHKDFSDWLIFIQKTCEGGVNLAGHSLGGAQAVLMAACAIEKKMFTVRGLYTIAAPAVTVKDQIRPADGKPCFNGARVFNQDRGGQDIVPVLSTALGFLHPKVNALNVSQDEEGAVTLSDIPCDSPEAANEPISTSILPNPVLHYSDQYVLRLNAAFQKLKLGPDTPKAGELEAFLHDELYRMAKAANTKRVASNGA